MLDDLRVYLRALAEDELARLGARPDGVSAGAAGSRAAATITWSPHAAAAPVRLRFAAEVATGGPALNESAADGTKYLWTWPDGTRSVGSVVERAFAYGGVYRVHLDVIGEDHAEATAETVVELEGPLDPLRLTPVFRSGEGEYAAFRIPSIVCAANGNLVAFAEGRVQSASDSAATIHIVCKVSADNGRTWGPLGVVARNVVAGVEYAAMNPSPVVDTQCGTGRIVLLFKKLECSEWEIARGHGLMRTFCVCSDDHGQTWWGERDITAQVHRPYLPALQERYPYAAQAENAPHDWRIQVPTLGHAIQLEGPGLPPALRGRILHIGSRTHGNSSVFASMNYAFWSDDLGENWEIGPTIAVRDDGMPAVGLNEATVVELPGGQVLVNSRNYREGAPVRRRAVTRGTFTSDGQLVFGPAGDDAALIEPPVQASLLRLCWAEQAPGDQRSRILFANPAHPFARVNLTVRVSYDEGATWPISRVIDRGPSAYSDLVVQADGEIGLLYERGNAGGIFYATFPLDWLEEGEEAANG
jgi:sialidase-1